MFGGILLDLPLSALGWSRGMGCVCALLASPLLGKFYDRDSEMRRAAIGIVK